jgi:hypothetical protein
MALPLNTSRGQNRHSEHAGNHPRVEGSASARCIIARSTSRALKDNYDVRSSHEGRLLAPLKQENRVMSLEKVGFHSEMCRARFVFAGRLARA